MPRSGRAEYDVDVIGVETVSDNVFAFTGSGVMQADFASGIVVTHGTLGDALLGTTQFSSEARISATANSFSGPFRFDDFGEFTGQLNGRFFGPDAEEVGAAFNARQSDGRIAVGTIFGRGSATSVTNTSLANLTANEFFTNDSRTIGATLTGSSGSNASTGVFTDRRETPGSIAINYDASLGAYTLIAAGRSLFGYRDTGAVRERLEFYRFGIMTEPQIPNLTLLENLNYVRGGRWSLVTSSGAASAYTITDFTYGVETPDAAVPRTGQAGYIVAISGSAADSDFPNFAKFSGTGTLTADFATGAIAASGNVRYSEDYFMSGRAAGSATGAFQLAARLSADANRFAGTIDLTGIGSYSGNLGGRFYGPEAQELGGVFSATDGTGGVASGVLVGALDRDLGPVTGLLELTQPTQLATIETSNPSNPNKSRDAFLTYDPATRSYGFYTSTPTNAGGIAYRFGPPRIDAAESDATVTVYRGSGPAGQFNAGDSFVASLFNPGATNPRLALTHTSFADVLITTPSPGGSHTTPHYVVFGVLTPTAQMPRTGSANFSGIIFGRGRIGVPATPSMVTLDGTSSLVANFTNAGFTTTLDITATDDSTGAIANLAPIIYTGTIVGNRLSTNTPSGSTGFEGNFFGPGASEFGAVFSYDEFDGTTRTSLIGLTVGKRD